MGNVSILQCRTKQIIFQKNKESTIHTVLYYKSKFRYEYIWVSLQKKLCNIVPLRDLKKIPDSHRTQYYCIYLTVQKDLKSPRLIKNIYCILYSEQLNTFKIRLGSLDTLVSTCSSIQKCFKYFAAVQYVHC